MLKIAALVWIVLGTTLAGVAMTIIVATPALANQAMQLIPWACGAAVVAAMPLSWLIAQKMVAQTGKAPRR